MFYSRALFIVSALLLMGASCATFPDRILPVPFTGKSFEDYSCEQLVHLSTRLEVQLAKHVMNQEKRASSDQIFATLIYGLASFHPPLAFLGFLTRGDGLEAQKIAQIKGEMTELDVYFNRKC